MIVATYQFGSRSGHIADDWFAGCSEEEIRKRRENARDVIGKLMYERQLKELEEKQAGAV